MIEQAIIPIPSDPKPAPPGKTKNTDNRVVVLPRKNTMDITCLTLQALKRLFIIEGVGVVCGVRRVVAG